jgi:hypothetical protein
VPSWFSDDRTDVLLIYRNPSGSDLKITARSLKQEPGIPRLKAMRAHRSLLLASVRTAVMVGMAILLILVLLPAALGVQAAGS